MRLTTRVIWSMRQVLIVEWSGRRVVAAATQVQILVRTGTALDTLHGVLR